MKDGKRRAGPQQDSNLDPLSQIGQQLPQAGLGSIWLEREMRCDVPAGDVDMGACPSHCLSYLTEGPLAVN
jgi:hypothetical protein